MSNQQGKKHMTWILFFSNESERYIREKQRDRERDRVGEMDAVACSDDLPSGESGLSRKKKHLSTRFVTQIISNYQTWRRDLVEEKSPPTMPLIIMCWSSVPSLSERFWLWDAPEEGPKKATPKETWQIWWEIGGLRDLKPDQVLFVLDGCKVCIWGRIRIEFQWLSNNLCTVN